MWAGLLSNKKIAVVLWNRGSSRATVIVYWSDIGLDPITTVNARDLWAVRSLIYIYIYIFEHLHLIINGIDIIYTQIYMIS